LPELRKLGLTVKREEGFTLIEVLAVMIIIGILAAIAIPAFFNQRNKANDSSSKEMAHTSEVAMEALASDNGGSYATASPANLNTVDSSIQTAPGSPPKPYASAASGTAKTWTFTITSPTGNAFTVAKSASGNVTYTCTVPAGNDRGGCPTGGTWG
jgi:type IV pilus assembly protein PilA